MVRFTRRGSARTPLSAVCVLMLGSALVAAESRPQAPKLVDAVSRGWIRPRLVWGRFAFSGIRPGLTTRVAQGDQSGETLAITASGQDFTALYRSAPSSPEDLVVEITAGSQLRIQRRPRGEADFAPVEFEQPDEGPLRLVVEQPCQKRVVRAPSLWHLLVKEPQACREHLIPLLTLLDGHSNLEGKANELESLLLRGAATGEPPDPTRWATLIEQLGDDRFARREAADRELRALGRVVLTYLRRLDRGRLDAEQQYRIERIVDHLSQDVTSDTVEDVAPWLAGDAVVWLDLLARDDESIRRLAAQRLKALLGEAIAVDPAADAATRAEQIERLRARIPGA